MRYLFRCLTYFYRVWLLWRIVKYDGLGNKISLWDAITWAADFKFWEGEE